MLKPLQAAVCTCRIAFGPPAGQKVLPVLTVLKVQVSMRRETDFKQTRCTEIDGCNWHAAVRCGADERQALAQLCRFITRPITGPDRRLPQQPSRQASPKRHQKEMVRMVYIRHKVVCDF